MSGLVQPDMVAGFKEAINVKRIDVVVTIEWMASFITTQQEEVCVTVMKYAQLWH